MMTYERLAQILLANGVNSPAELEKVLRYVLVLRDRPLPLDCPAGGGGSNQDGAGDPGGALVPDFVGQRYKDTNTGNIWIANSTTPGDWTLEVQNLQTQWTPTTLKLGESIGFNSIGDMPGLTSLTFLQPTTINGFGIGYAANLVSISFPNLISVDPGGISFPVLSLSSLPALALLSLPVLTTTIDSFDVFNCDALLAISLPNYATCGYRFRVNGCALLASISVPSLVTITDKCTCANNPALTTVSMPVWLPTNGTEIDFRNDALTATSVNHILARAVANVGYVSGSMILNGGTNAAPTGQGINDAATLTGRGVVISTN